MPPAEEPKSPQPDAAPAPGCCEDQIRDWCRVAEKCAREEPLKCTATAFLVGLIITILPVGQIAGALTRLLLSLIRPALMVFGAMKIFEEIEKRRKP